MTSNPNSLASRPFWSDAALELEDFCSQAKSFSKSLDAAKDFNELHNLWQSTKLPYRCPDVDPYDQEYLDFVKSLYQRLTGGQYELGNELTSTKVDPKFFEIGFPWATGRLDIISAELAKVVQALRALHEQPDLKRIIEFGSGWGNLALPMARSGLDVTVIDIDINFLNRLKKIFSRESLPLGVIHSDFLNAARPHAPKYDAAIFQASFHHCLEFDELLRIVKSEVLNEGGVIYFLSEPIFEKYDFPWGLRFDGESLWAIMKNQWLELGFDRGFFSQLLANNGYFLVEIPPVHGIIGCGYKAVPMEKALPFDKWVLTDRSENSFHRPDGAGGTGRFCQSISYLPPLKCVSFSSYNLVVTNFNVEPLTLTIRSRSFEERVTVQPGARIPLKITARGEEIAFECDTFVPSVVLGNGDTRELGLSFVSIFCD